MQSYSNSSVIEKSIAIALYCLPHFRTKQYLKRRGPSDAPQLHTVDIQQIFGDSTRCTFCCYWTPPIRIRVSFHAITRAIALQNRIFNTFSSWDRFNISQITVISTDSTWLDFLICNLISEDAVKSYLLPWSDQLSYKSSVWSNLCRQAYFGPLSHLLYLNERFVPGIPVPCCMMCITWHGAG